ncbi:DUF2442 domain-containing protein [bacterium]|nr:DUF2442 domain-containing protein [bacterium]
MNTLVSKPLAINLHFNDDTMWLELADGRQLGVPLAYFPRLLNAAPEQREEYSISGGGTGLHWNKLDEDILVENLLLGIGDVQTRSLKAEAEKVTPRMLN